MDIARVEVGRIYWIWVWVGTSHGGSYDVNDLADVTVLRKGRKKVFVQGSSGWSVWIYPERLIEREE